MNNQKLYLFPEARQEIYPSGDHKFTAKHFCPEIKSRIGLDNYIYKNCRTDDRVEHTIILTQEGYDIISDELIMFMIDPEARLVPRDDLKSHFSYRGVSVIYDGNQ